MTRYPGRLVLIGDPVSHSLSPEMQNAALGSAKIPLQYEAVQVDEAELARFLKRMREIDGAGNVTIPHKTTVGLLSDQRSPVVDRTKACNVFKCVDGNLVVDNTDVPAFDRVAKNLLGDETANARVTLIGAGGAGAAVLSAIETWNNPEVTIINRRPARATALEKLFPKFTTVETDMRRALATATLVVNATPVGQLDDSEPCDVSLLAPDAAVIDLVYRRGQTPWVRRATSNGHKAVDGMPMLLEQGALAFKFWFGVEPDREAMQHALS